jgi:hypothetical protein
MEKWTKESAIEWAMAHGHKFVTNGKGGATLVLSKEAGLTALSCADYLRKTIHIRVSYPKHVTAS